jgi:hypothetical protein
MERLAADILAVAFAILSMALGIIAVFYTAWFHRLWLRLSKSNDVFTCLTPEWYEQYMETKFALFCTKVSGLGAIFMGLVVLLVMLLCAPRTP